MNQSFYTINSLLIGKRHSGKSVFVNYLSNKLLAREGFYKDGVTKNINEYYIYREQKDLKKNFLKLIETHGFMPDYCYNNENEKILTTIKKIVEKNEIHFILFFFMENDSLEGLDYIFKILDSCKIPVLFIINKAFDESNNGKTKDIINTMLFLKNRNFENLIDENNFIGINIVRTRKILCFGVEDIFKRMYEIFKEKNLFNEDKLIKNFWNKYYTIKNENEKKKKQYLIIIICVKKWKY